MPLTYSVVLAAAAFLPGTVISLAFGPGRPESWIVVILRGVVVSGAMLVILSLGLLRLGGFSAATVMGVLGALTATVGVVRRRRLAHVGCRVRADRRDTIAVVTLLLVAGAVVLLTPKWNFLVAPGMDAGNYELYASWWSGTGDLYLPVRGLLDAGVDADLLDWGNAWKLRDGWSEARPSYFYGYPALLAVVRGATGSLTASWVVSAATSIAALVGAYVLALRVAAPRVVAWVTAVLVFFTPLFVFYAKQIMSESTALLGVLAVVLGMVGMDEGRRPDPWMLVSGIVLAFTSKIDATLPVLVLMAIGVIAAGAGRWPARAPTGTWGLAGLASTVLSVVLVAGLVDPGYLGKSSVASRLRFLEGVPRADVPLFTWLMLACGIGWLVIVRLARRTTTNTGQDPGTVSLGRASRLAVLGVAIAWLAYLGWNAFLRPATGGLDANHDALNLVRLDDVYSLALLAVIAFFPLVVAATGRAPRDGLVPAVALLLVFAYLILDANHSPTQVWWMRRYLVVLVPLTVLAAASTAVSTERWWRGRGVPAVIVAGLLVLAVGGWHLARIVPVLDYRQNISAPTSLGSLVDAVDQPDAIVVVGGGIVRGFGLMVASVEGVPVLTGLPSGAVGGLPDFSDGPTYVLSAEPLEAPERQGVELVDEGTLEAQWAGWLFVFDRGPAAYTRSADYWLYVRPDPPAVAGIPRSGKG